MKLNSGPRGRPGYSAALEMYRWHNAVYLQIRRFKKVHCLVLLIIVRLTYCALGLSHLHGSDREMSGQSCKKHVRFCLAAVTLLVGCEGGFNLQDCQIC